MCGNMTELKYQFKNVLLLGVVVHAFNPRTQEAEAGRSVCCRTAKASYTVRSCLKRTKQTAKQQEATLPQQTANAALSQTAEKASEMMYCPPQLLSSL